MFYVRQAIAKRAKQRPRRNCLIFDEVFSRENLFRTFQLLADRGRVAPGIDGFTIDDLSPVEFGRIAGVASKAIAKGSYRPRPTRDVYVPKSKGGRRRIQVACITDSVIAKALTEALTDRVDSVFLGGSFGERPNRSAHHMFAAMEFAMERSGARWLATADVRKAYDSVRLADVDDVWEGFLGSRRWPNGGNKHSTRFNKLIKLITRGADSDRKVGIPQGSALSPLSINLLLHHAHDIPVEGIPAIWFRYVDDITYLCHSAAEGSEALSRLRRLLKPYGLQQRDGSSITDLTCETATVLGAGVSWDRNRLVISTPQASWDDLEENLRHVWNSPNPMEQALVATHGWLSYFGPALESTDVHVDRLLDIMARVGVNEIGSREALLAACSTSWSAYRSRRYRIRKRLRRKASWTRCP